MTWNEYVEGRAEAMRGRSTFVVVGLNRIITPGNRTKVGPLLLRPDARWNRKVSVDRTLYVGEPWRAYFHFAFCRASFGEYTYSYLAETHWRAFGEGIRPDDPFSVDAIATEGNGLVRSEYPTFFERFSVTPHDVAPSVRAAYQEEKALAFDEEHTSSAIVTRLSAFAKSAGPLRDIPTTTTLFAKTAHDIHCTSLPVDRYLTDQLAALVAHTDGVGRACHGRD